MKRAILISAVFMLVLLTSLFILNATQKNSIKIQNSHTDQSKNEASCCSNEIGTDEVSDYSLFQLDSEWNTESSNTITLKSFKGKTIIMAMIFANCTYACPIIVNDMKNIENSLTKKELDKTNFVLISIDPDRDTPEALKQFAERFGLDLKRWKLLTSNKNNVDELSAVLGFKYKEENDGGFSHSNIINIINSNGEVVSQHFGLNQKIRNIVTELKNNI